MTAPGRSGAHHTARDAPVALWWVLLALAIAVYVFGISGQYIPTNGDELVYAHIARVTAATGHWLPLASEFEAMRNTKPPLLFWQAMVAGNWGDHWTLFALRLPSLIYTGLITAAVGYTTHAITRSQRSALIAACVYLGFFCTFRYGRPYLTSAPETFWLDLPLFGLLWVRLAQNRSNQPSKQVSTPFLTSNVLQVPVNHQYFATISVASVLGLGVAWGLGSAYKSFALIAPAAAAFWCALLLSEPALTWRRAVQVSGGVFVSAVLALGIFGLWFVLDPDPVAVWQEFVMGENAGKMSDKKGYWHEALYGGDASLWAQALAYLQNAGLLAFLVPGLAWVGLRSLKTHALSKIHTIENPIPAHLWILLGWLAVWLVVFSIPSQRSARYVIPAMPALAIVMALVWERIPRGWFLASYVLTGIATLTLGRIAWVAHDLGIASGLELGWVMVFAIIGALATLAGLLKIRFTRVGVVAACLGFYACFNLTVAPLDGPSGRFSADVAARFNNVRIAVPSNFRGQYERFQFLLPGNHFEPFDMAVITDSNDSAPKLTQLLETHDAVVWGPAASSETEPVCLPNCKVVATRWVVKERHKSGDVTLANLWYPHTWLFTREWLLVKR